MVKKAHGLVAGRCSARYNASWIDIKNQDYAGSIELRGNVSVVVNGSNSYAFLVDSYDGTNGADTQGNIATIRSYNSETNTIVEDKVYKVKGNMLAKNAGIINLWMGDRSNFWGTTQTTINGILNQLIITPLMDSSLTMVALLNCPLMHWLEIS